MGSEPRDRPDSADARGTGSGAAKEAAGAAQASLIPVNEPAAAGYGTAVQSETTRLMTAVQAGDPGAFDELVRGLRGRAYHVATSLVGSRDDAMELCQETFLKVFKSRPSQLRCHPPELGVCSA